MLDINLLLQTSSCPQHLVSSTPQHVLGLGHQPHQMVVLLENIPEEPREDHDPQIAGAQSDQI
uniref:Uncharacterized protein n=1 Tax=Arundo donax TaxID=35708 RepID=A0A0A9EWV1_ARUDO